jgi:CBS domain-containing protein
VITVIAFNVALIANAGLGSQSWSLAKQSIRSITDSPSCGLADSISVSDLWELAPPKLSAALSAESQYLPLYVETESTFNKRQVLRPVLGIGESQFATDWYAVSQMQTNLVLRIDDAINISEIGIQIDEQTDPSGQYITLVVGPVSQPVATDPIYLDFGKISALVQGSKFQLIFKTFEPGQNFAISEPLLTDSKLLSDVVTQHHLEAKIDPFIRFIHIKDLIRLDANDEIKVKYLMHNVTYCYKTDNLLKIFEIFRRGVSHMAFVVDTENVNNCIGIVTLNDIIETFTKFKFEEIIANEKSKGVEFLKKMINKNEIINNNYYSFINSQTKLVILQVLTSTLNLYSLK